MQNIIKFKLAGWGICQIYHVKFLKGVDILKKTCYYYFLVVILTYNPGLKEMFFDRN